MSPLNRRAFLMAVSAAGALHAASHPTMDTHVHFYDPRRPEGVPWPPKTDGLLYRTVLPKEYEALVRPLGVTGAIIVEASPRLEDNQWVLELAQENAFLAGVVGNLQQEEFAANLARFSKNRLFRGIRLNGAAIARGVHETAFVANLRRLADADLSLDAIGGAAMPQALVRVADAVPTLRIAINHMPVEPAGWNEDDHARASLRELGRRPQVFAKVSGVLKRTDGQVPVSAAAYKLALDEVWDLFSPDRVMYGSNWPVSDRLAPYAAVLGVVRDYVTARGAEDAAKYFWRNSQACYKWTRP